MQEWLLQVYPILTEGLSVLQAPAQACVLALPLAVEEIQAEHAHTYRVNLELPFWSQL